MTTKLEKENRCCGQLEYITLMQVIGCVGSLVIIKLIYLIEAKVKKKFLSPLFGM